MSQEECRRFENKLAYHVAPSLLGIKCANLISLENDEFNILGQIERFNEIAGGRKLKIRLMCRCKKRTLLLLYNEKLLLKCLSEPARREILKAYGYGGSLFKLESDLERLAERISSENEFPHEIGIFLGYPAEDVKGFIIHKGNNFKLCGCWKVYGDEEKARRSFTNYDKCRKFLCNKLNQGSDIYRALRIS